MGAILNKELVKYQDRLFWIYRKTNASSVKSEHVQDVKDFWLCDIVLKQKTPHGSEVLLFLREIPEAEIIN
jgi:hypothetical protein